MAKKINTIDNPAGGIDLLTERDAGNEVRILTGKPSASREFWEALRDCCDGALAELEGRKDKPKA
jgi:hypothetical protein